MVTTQTIGGTGAQATDDSGSGSADNGGDDEDAGVRAEIVTSMVVLFGVLAGAYNIF